MHQIYSLKHCEQPNEPNWLTAVDEPSHFYPARRRIRPGLGQIHQWPISSWKFYILIKSFTAVSRQAYFPRHYVKMLESDCYVGIRNGSSRFGLLFSIPFIFFWIPNSFFVMLLSDPVKNRKLLMTKSRKYTRGSQTCCDVYRNKEAIPKFFTAIHQRHAAKKVVSFSLSVRPHYKWRSLNSI